MFSSCDLDFITGKKEKKKCVWSQYTPLGTYFKIRNEMFIFRMKYLIGFVTNY